MFNEEPPLWLIAICSIFSLVAFGFLIGNHSHHSYEDYLSDFFTALGSISTLISIGVMIAISRTWKKEFIAKRVFEITTESVTHSEDLALDMQELILETMEILCNGSITIESTCSSFNDTKRKYQKFHIKAQKIKDQIDLLPINNKVIYAHISRDLTAIYRHSELKIDSNQLKLTLPCDMSEATLKMIGVVNGNLNKTFSLESPPTELYDFFVDVHECYKEAKKLLAKELLDIRFSYLK